MSKALRTRKIAAIEQIITAAVISRAARPMVLRFSVTSSLEPILRPIKSTSTEIAAVCTAPVQARCCL